VPRVGSRLRCNRPARHGTCALNFARARVRVGTPEVLHVRAFSRHGSPGSAPRGARSGHALFAYASEERLWRCLSGSKTGFAFRRQLVIGNFIVDFACTEVRLGVEVDGGYHEEQARQDAARDRELARLGWRVLHVQEDEVFEDVGGIVGRIVEAAAER
jgi:very-short-patch-repair endonuclease